MSVTHYCEWTPPITQPQQFAAWSRDVQQLLDYLPRYVAAGRKQRIFAVPWEEISQQSSGFAFTPDMFCAYYEQHHLEPLILPNQHIIYEQFIQQLPVSTTVDMAQDLFKGFLQVHDYEQSIGGFYGQGPGAFSWFEIPGSRSPRRLLGRQPQTRQTCEKDAARSC